MSTVTPHLVLPSLHVSPHRTQQSGPSPPTEAEAALGLRSAQVRADPAPVRAGSEVRPDPACSPAPSRSASWPQSPLASGGDTERWKRPLPEAVGDSAHVEHLFLMRNLWGPCRRADTWMANNLRRGIYILIKRFKPYSLFRSVRGPLLGHT